MQKMFLNVILVLAVLGFSSFKAEVKSQTSQDLNLGWNFKKSSDREWLSASVPGCVHTDLIDNEVIDDPFYRLNETKIQWIEKEDWVYTTSFNVDKKVFKKDNIELCFEGLDTYADVYLNDSLVLSADNMFRTWDLSVKDLLKKKNNVLTVYFNNVFKINQHKFENAPFLRKTFPNNDQHDIKLSPYSRKAGFHYGWDWGPRLVTSGIWKPVYLRSWNNFKINSVHYRQKKVSDKLAKINAVVEISSDTNKELTLDIKHEDTVLATSAVKLTKGVNVFTVPFEINNPKLWWTNGLGEQPLYNLILTASGNKIGKVSKNTRIGIRSVEVVREKDQFGTSMYVRLNGVPVFMKGVNYIPQDNFQNRVTKQRYEETIESAVKANMNMLRVWGGGVYENDEFYDICDEKGILVWQDMMFACGMFPADSAYLQSVSREVIDNVTRMRNHPCIALYCGNNENEMAWWGWGWKNKTPEQYRDQYEQEMKDLFYKAIPEAISKVDPDAYYHPSSPIANYNGKGKGEGDTHYWGVWGGKNEISSYRNNVSRFVSEYGFQSYPDFSSVKKFTIAEDWDLKSEVMQSHQRCMSGNRTDKDHGNRLIREYMDRHFKAPDDFAHYLDVAQILQAKAVSYAIQLHRKSMTDKYCMGTLYWQINDCWPVASWASIDYYGKWKALHYQVKRDYEPILIVPMVEKEDVSVYVVTDEVTPRGIVSLEMSLMDFKGNVKWSKMEKVNMPENTSELVYTRELEKLLGSYANKEVFLNVKMVENGTVIAQNQLFFEADKDLDLPDTDIKYSVQPTEKGYAVELKSDVLAKYVKIIIDNDDVFVEDNFFHLLPGESKVVEIVSEKEIEDIEGKLKVVSLVAPNCKY